MFTKKLAHSKGIVIDIRPEEEGGDAREEKRADRRGNRHHQCHCAGAPSIAQRPFRSVHGLS
jgi:hypothetical protein